MMILLGYAGIFADEVKNGVIDWRKLSPNPGSSLIRDFGGWKMVKNRRGKFVKVAKKRVIQAVPPKKWDLTKLPVLRPRKIELFDAGARLQQIVLMAEWVKRNNYGMFRLASEEVKVMDCSTCGIEIPEENVMYPSDVCYICSMPHKSEGCFVVQEQMTLKRWVEEIGYQLAMKEKSLNTT
jgi:hypothetical protein